MTTVTFQLGDDDLHRIADAVASRLEQRTEQRWLTDVHFDQPINVVATPLSSTPCFVTLNHALVNVEDDLEIQAWSWDSDGNPAPGVWSIGNVALRCGLEGPSSKDERRTRSSFGSHAT